MSKRGLDRQDKVLKSNGTDNSTMKEEAKEYEFQLLKMQDAIDSDDPYRMKNEVLDWKPKAQTHEL